MLVSLDSQTVIQSKQVRAELTSFSQVCAAQEGLNQRHPFQSALVPHNSPFLPPISYTSHF